MPEEKRKEEHFGYILPEGNLNPFKRKSKIPELMGGTSGQENSQEP